MLKKSIIGILLLVGLGTSGYGQDPLFSQFYANPLYLNPAMAGSIVCPRLTMNYRNQWPSISGTYVTYNASFDMFMERLSGGVGFLVTSDKAGEGALTTNMVSGMYSYRLTLNRFENVFLNAGFQATYMQRKIDWDKLTFPDQIDPKYGFVNLTQEKQPPNLSIGFADFSAGMLFSYKEDFYAGVSFNHITQPNDGFYSDISSKLYMKMTAHMGTVIQLTRKRQGGRTMEDVTLSPNILYQQQQNFHQLNYGMYVNYYPFTGGVWFRQNFENADAVILLAGFRQPSFKLAYSYDLTVSKLTNITGGAHEISFAWLFKCPPKKKRIKTINCPTF